MRLFQYRDGLPLCVLRPEDPKKALAASKSILERFKSGTLPLSDASREFNGVLRLQQYQFVGYAGLKAGEILDTDGKPVGSMKPGDSFVTGPQFARPRAEARQ